MTTKTTLNPNMQAVFLVKFQFTTGYLITSDLAKCLQDNSPTNGRGIEFIKRFNPEKGKFERVSKKVIRRLHSFDTEADLYFDSHYYFN